MTSTSLEARLCQARILVVDDESDIVAMLMTLLNIHHYNSVRGTTDPYSVRTLHDEFRPDLILLDLMMPGLNRFELMTELQDLTPADSFLPIVVLTADSSHETRHQALQSGAHDFLTKPFEHSEVLLRIQNLLKTRLLHLQLQEQNEALQRLSQRLIEAQEAERRRIAQALHDEIGAAFTSVKINMQAVQHYLQAQPCPIETHLEEGIDILNRAHQQVRELSLNLRPSMLDDFGLADTLQWYVDRQSQWAGIEARYQMETLERRPSAAIETACFRIAQEALTNILRHANASRIEIGLFQRESTLTITIRDNGAGFDVDKVREELRRSGSQGLLGMEERVLLLGGHIHIESAPGCGTKIRVDFPLSDSSTQRSSSAGNENFNAPAYKRQNGIPLDGISLERAQR